ncbi:MAG: hypothetical protein IJF33_02075 [Clostridia bacterium]|nr:hypothetical protein [Clostridia bacterium]
MYEYDPHSSKKAEKTLLFLLLALAVVLLLIAEIPGILFPFFYQLVGFLSLMGAILLTGRCVLRRFTYRIEPREDVPECELLDLVITEHHSHQAGVVCRISVEDIEDVKHLTSQNRKEVSAMLRKKRVYYYTAQLFASNCYLLTVRDEDEIFYIRLLADSQLLSFIKHR